MLLNRTRKFIFTCGLLFPLSFLCASPVLPLTTNCTTWASIGDRNANGGLIIAKNRDSSAGYEYLQVVHPQKGIPYIGLFYNETRQHPYPYIAAAANKNGLYIVQNEAAASPVTAGYSDANQSSLIYDIISRYSSVKQVLANKDKIFTHSSPNFLIIGDKHQALLVEIGTHKKQYRLLKATEHGNILYHTNHYVLPQLIHENSLFYLDSKMRFARIKFLMTNETQPYTFNIVHSWTNDQQDGVINSIFREFTVASWIAIAPKTGDPFLWVRFTSPKQKYQTFRLTLNKQFWQEKGILSSTWLKKLNIPGPISTKKQRYNESI